MTGPTSGSRDPRADAAPAEETPADVRLFTWILAGLGLLTVLLVVGATLWQVRQQRRNESLDQPRALAPFKLLERSGREVRDTELRGQVLVVNFVFTGCSYSCFQISQRMAEVQEALRDQDGVRLVSISLDPRSDSPAALVDFARKVKADAERWWFLTGPKDEVYALIETSFLAKARNDPDPREA
ncbi:MAG: SCO family protein, partial [Verrucomicrobiales bacterium]|nr:SCO family protein [Verrucomicrobiales bacterium]